jgi:hydroxymethylbilane synthase
VRLVSRPRIRLGTRGSPLARKQAEMTAAALKRAWPELADSEAIEVVIIRTTGDRVIDRPLAEVGGKGLFCKEIETALLEERIDVAVHSIKDLPTWLPDGLMLAAVLEREDPRDVLIATEATSIETLPHEARVGSASLRRKGQLLAARPDLKVGLLRGNVQTRLDKIRAGELDATMLALAGLRRLGIDPIPGTVLDAETFVPAVGQGAVGLEVRAADGATRELVMAIDHAPTRICVEAERAMLDALDGSCHTPVGGHARIRHDELVLKALLAEVDGSHILQTERVGKTDDRFELGRDAGLELRSRARPGFFD